MTEPERPEGVEVDEKLVLRRSLAGDPYRSTSEVVARRTLTIRYGPGRPLDWQRISLFGCVSFMCLIAAANAWMPLAAFGVCVMLTSTAIAWIVSVRRPTARRLVATEQQLSGDYRRVATREVRRLIVAERGEEFALRAETRRGTRTLAVTPTLAEAEYMRFRIEKYLAGGPA